VSRCTLNKMGVAAEEVAVSPGRNTKKNRKPLNGNFTGTQYVKTVRCKSYRPSKSNAVLLS
jgi:hypothetical protein